MDYKGFWVSLIVVSLILQLTGIMGDNEYRIKLGQWFFSVGLTGFFLS